MKVLQIYRDYFTRMPGGIERHVYQLAHGLQAVAEVDVLVSSGGRRSHAHRDGEVLVHMMGELTRWQGLSITPKMIPWLKRSDYDIVHVHSPYPMGELAMRVARIDGIRVATYHADLDRGARLMPAYRRFLWWVYTRCDRVLVSSEQMIERSPVLARLNETRPEALEIVPFGVDTDRFFPGPSERSEELRRKWGPEPIVLFLGRLRYYKGLHILIRAMRDVDAKLVVVGQGPLRKRVIPMGRELLGERFVHVPRAPDEDLPDFYRAADIFCLPSTSRAEAFGISALEAMACGVPPITTHLGTGTSIVNLHEHTGLVVPPRDIDRLRDAIVTLAADAELRAQLGKSARQRAEESFGLKTMLERVALIYSDLLGQR
jgi:glycosyltransferase involved in cell wall biosynthesis